MAAKSGCCTQEKHEHFRYMLSVHMAASASIIKRSYWMHPHYLYIDLNAGPGRYADGRIGSPIIAIQEAKKHPEQYFEMWFVENDPNTVDILRENVKKEVGDAEHIMVNVSPLDNKWFLMRFSDLIRRSKPAVGLVFSDENGVDVPFRESSLLLQHRMFHSVDVVFYLAANSWNRVRIVHGKPFLMDGMGLIGKDHWIVRSASGRSRWTFLIATNWSRKSAEQGATLCGFPGFKKLGFVPIDTVEGRLILDELNTTKKERALRLGDRQERHSICELQAVSSNSRIQSSQMSLF